SEQERDEWTSEGRSAKAQLLTTLNITHPNSTLTSSASTQHVRKVLAVSLQVQSKKEKAKDKEREKGKDKLNRGSSVPAERRRKVEHWVSAIWIPDGRPRRACAVEECLDGGGGGITVGFVGGAFARGVLEG
ncbi:hypothetical protein CVT26_013044, partial [Gymnopilus dilepis]